jgi:aminoglycoside phosphotransferase (APT) family kinase protein
MSDPEAAVSEGTDPAPGTGSPRGIDGPGVSAWFEQNVPGVTLPLSFSLVAGGRSNLTFVVTDAAGARYVLRRPPTGHLLPGAHDMGREFRIISAMGPAGVPVPSALGLCTDESVNGAPFYVMSFVEGLILRTEDDAIQAMDTETRHRTGLDLVDTLAQIHQADPDEIGLGELGRKEGYITRQLRRWYENYKAANESYGGGRHADVDEMHEWLSARIPEQKRASVVHGDYRLDNCMVSPAGEVIAVLDWEICTLGDPLADIGGLLVYWPEPGERSPLGASPTTAPGFPTRAEVTERYGAATGWDLSELDFYVTFAYWKLACILEGVYARYVNGAMGNDGFDFTVYPDLIAWLAAESRRIASGLGR